MVFSTTTQYALKILAYMNEHKERLCSAKTLSEELDIPYKYLTKIMTKFTKNEMIESIQGRYGGFKLIDSKIITIYDILKLCDGDSAKACIIGKIECNEKKKCHYHDAWQKPRASIKKDFLDADLKSCGVKDS
ncbi:MAG: Rrf2 family transcriptional regulator [Sulfurimonas sp.]|nr:Rrf2 family transcriptional regulator [Sulfurimonas sp.]